MIAFCIKNINFCSNEIQKFSNCEISQEEYELKRWEAEHVRTFPNGKVYVYPNGTFSEFICNRALKNTYSYPNMSFEEIVKNMKALGYSEYYTLSQNCETPQGLDIVG